jgi:hypothetical protein
VKRVTSMALLLVASGCASHGAGPSSVPTRVKSGQSWLITRQVVATQVLGTCVRAPHPSEGYWAPNRQQIEQLEADQLRLRPMIEQPGDFDRQYIGILSRGQQMIYINAFHLHDRHDTNPAREAIRGCDDNGQYWNALYNPQTGEFSSIQINGALLPSP